MIREAAGSRPRTQHVRYLPLGSPWVLPNWSYVHVPSGPRLVAGPGCARRAGRWVGTWEGGIPGTTPSQYPYLRYTRLFNLNIARQGPVRTPQALQGPPGPSAHLLLTHARGPRLGRDSDIYILKLVNSRECRRNSVMRPVILPVSKTGSENHDLEF